MSLVQLPDALRQVIVRQVEEGRAESEEAFLAEAVERYAEELEHYEEEIKAAAIRGIADIEAGRYVTIASPEDSRRLHERLMAELHQSLAAGR